MLPPGITQAPLCTAPCSPSTGVYNPKAFILHAASLGQACAHCRRFSTAATRRCLGSVSVPVRRVMLSHPLPIVALVGHYPTNKLVGRSLLLGRNHTFDPGMLSGITHSFPWLFRTLGHITTRYSPFRRCPASKASFRNLLARLACLIHAANVHSEPGSNPSNVIVDRRRLPLPRRRVLEQRVEEKTGRRAMAEGRPSSAAPA